MQDDYIPTDSDAISCPTSLPGCVKAAFSKGQLTMRLADPGIAIVNRTKLITQLETAFAVIYVFDLSCFSVKDLLQYESTVNSHWLRNSSIIVIFNNFKGFAKRLAEEPLSDEFPNYVGGDSEKAASNFIVSKIRGLNWAHLQLYTHSTDGVYDEKNLRIVWRSINDSIMSRNLKALNWL
jgi:hypothetical protein